jgi:protein tyrosine phosphatase (PTP) superfamily phosphohydrolase (DUF442 family)
MGALFSRNVVRWGPLATTMAVTILLLRAPAALAQAAGAREDDAGAPVATEKIRPRKIDRTLASPRNDVPGAANLAQVGPALWRSAQPTAEGFKNLKAMGIRTVVSLRRISSDRAAMAGNGLRYVHIHFAPWHAENEDVVTFLKVVSDPQNQPVLVHCQHGADRTGTMVAIYRAFAQDWALTEAMQELPRFGFHTIWSNLKRYLERLDMAALRAEVAAAPVPAVEVVP